MRLISSKITERKKLYTIMTVDAAAYQATLEDHYFRIAPQSTKFNEKSVMRVLAALALLAVATRLYLA